jgi:hypothetical protein
VLGYFSVFDTLPLLSFFFFSPDPLFFFLDDGLLVSFFFFISARTTTIYQAKQGVQTGSYGASRKHLELVLVIWTFVTWRRHQRRYLFVAVVCSLRSRVSFLSLFVRYPPRTNGPTIATLFAPRNIIIRKIRTTIPCCTFRCCSHVNINTHIISCRCL